MPTLDLSTKGSFIIYQQGVIENQNKFAKRVIKLVRQSSKSKISTITKIDKKDTADSSEL